MLLASLSSITGLFVYGFMGFLKGIVVMLGAVGAIVVAIMVVVLIVGLLKHGKEVWRRWLR